MANDFKTPNKTRVNNPTSAKPKKMVMVSELRRGTRFVHPDSTDIKHVNYKDEICVGYGAVAGLTSDYFREGDLMWNKAVELL